MPSLSAFALNVQAAPPTSGVSVRAPSVKLGVVVSSPLMSLGESDMILAEAEDAVIATVTITDLSMYLFILVYFFIGFIGLLLINYFYN